MRSHFLRTVAAPAFISEASNELLSPGSTITITLPTYKENDLLISILTSTNGTTSWTPPSGWTEVLDSDGRQVCYKKAAASETDPQFTNSSASYLLEGYVLVYRNAAYDAITALSTSALSITLTTNKSVIIGYASRQTVGGITFTAPSGFTELSATSGTDAPSSAIFAKSVSGGTTSGILFTASVGTANSMLIGLKPGSY